MHSLTARELEILTLITYGKSNKAVADSLCLEVGTVKNHMTTIMQKLMAHDRTHAVVLALQQDLIHIKGVIVSKLPVRFYDLSIRSHSDKILD